MDSESLKALVSEVVREIIARRSSSRTVALGSDHGGFELKEQLKVFLQGQGFAVTDVGTHSKAACDYPDLAKAVCRAVLDGTCQAGIMIDGAGIGSSMVCNKFRGIRAAFCHDLKTVMNSKQHNNANVLTLGSGANTPDGVEGMVKTWLDTPFEGGRHQVRVDKIEQNA